METAITTRKTAEAANLIAARQKVNNLLSLRKITQGDISDLSPLELDCLAKTATNKLRQLTGEERDDFLDKIELIVPETTKSNIWEANQLAITNAISSFMTEHGIMPTIGAIADEAGLSRQTVAKHLKEYKTRPEFIAEVEQLRFMAPKLVASLYKSAAKGDTRAARLYLETVGAVNRQQPGTLINQQNNYIQINNTILSQENLGKLSAEQLDQIERIVRGVEK
jgi:hypothetical protein